MTVDTYQVHRKIVDAFIDQLQLQFATHGKYPFVRKSNGDPDYDNSKFYISDTHPDNVWNYPWAVIESVTSKETRSLDDEFLYEVRDIANKVIAEERGTSLVSDVTIKVYSEMSAVRDEITDAMYDFLKKITDALAAQGIGIIRMDMPALSTEKVGTKIYVVKGISCEVISEWNTQDAGFLNVTRIETVVETEP